MSRRHAEHQPYGQLTSEIDRKLQAAELLRKHERWPAAYDRYATAWQMIDAQDGDAAQKRRAATGAREMARRMMEETDEPR